jgi:hypothetical protein
MTPGPTLTMVAVLTASTAGSIQPRSNIDHRVQAAHISGQFMIRLR